VTSRARMGADRNLEVVSSVAVQVVVSRVVDVPIATIKGGVVRVSCA
jgi:hypothetical protein